MAVTCWMLNYVYPEHGILAPAVGFGASFPYV